MRIDPLKVAAIIGEIAEEIIAPRFGKLSPDNIRTKSGPNDMVTDVDEAAERALERALREIAPGAAFVGEEDVARDPSRADVLSGVGAAWVVDPLDGTRNFIRGISEFGAIVAYVEGGETQMGWIYAVPEKMCAVAVRGEGASWGGAPFRPHRQPSVPPHGLRSLGWLAAPERDRVLAALSGRFSSKPADCSAYSYLRLARGDADFMISSRIHPWDHLAGGLIVSELGGRSAFLDTGEALTPQPPADRALLVVAPGRDWTTIAAGLRA